MQPGDFVEADLEFVVFPTDSAAYYGPDAAFRERLTKHADTWQLVQREAVGNALQVEARRGTLRRAYPLVMEVDEQQAAEAQVTGGNGFVPLTFTGLGASRGYTLWLDGRQVDQSIHGNDFWQTDYDAVRKQWRMTFNVRLSEDAKVSHSLRFAPDA